MEIFPVHQIDGREMKRRNKSWECILQEAGDAESLDPLYHICPAPPPSLSNIPSIPFLSLKAIRNTTLRLKLDIKI